MGVTWLWVTWVDYRQIDTIQDEIRRLDNQKEVSIEEIKLILIKFISRTGIEIKKIQKLKRLKRKLNDGKERMSFLVSVENHILSTF